LDEKPKTAYKLLKKDNILRSVKKMCDLFIIYHIKNIKKKIYSMSVSRFA